MTENITLVELLKIMSECSGDEAIDLISRFQSGALTVEDFNAEDFERP